MKAKISLSEKGSVIINGEPAYKFTHAQIVGFAKELNLETKGLKTVARLINAEMMHEIAVAEHVSRRGVHQKQRRTRP